MHADFATTMVTIVVAVILLVVIALATAQYLARIYQTVVTILSAIAGVGRTIRQFKDDHLESWVDAIPIGADSMTILRPICIGIGLDRFIAEARGLAVLFFALGWLFDLTDGLKASAEAKRRGRPTRHGKYLDPAVDILSFVLMVVVLWANFPGWLMVSFSIGIGLRVACFTAIVAGRLWWGWRDRLPSNVLPHSIAGQFKTVFTALGFGLIILNGQPGVRLDLATNLLVTATILEFLSLIELGRGVHRNLNRAPSAP